MEIAINLKDYLLNMGYQVTTNLFENDIDIILITEPRKPQNLPHIHILM